MSRAKNQELFLPSPSLISNEISVQSTAIIPFDALLIDARSAAAKAGRVFTTRSWCNNFS
jgi:hypothetical protein